MSRYPKLLQPLEVHGRRLINRVIMGSMHTGLEEGNHHFDHSLRNMAAFYEERARGGVGLIVTGGIAPNNAGRVAPLAAMMTTPSDAARHREVTEAVHQHKDANGDGPKIAMQILHAGRYGYHPFNVSSSGVKAPIGWFTPKPLSERDIERTIDDFVRAAALAEEAGYDGVEVMGSEGYLINQFIAKQVNTRTDQWGGAFDNRIRLALRIVEGVRAATQPDFLIVFRLSMLDLVEAGSDWPEVVALAQALEAAGVSIINTGIGWHEARIPTIATKVPRAGFSWVTHKLMGAVSVPLVATNRINTPEVAEQVLASGHADMVSMARPFLADAFLVQKAAEGREEEINTCIACNQACLDHTFAKRRASCLVNPRAGYEAELNYTPAAAPLRVAVVGAGPAGLACSTVAARRGHRVTLFDSAGAIGGQFNLAKQVPGKEEFHETLRYFRSELRLSGVDVRLGQRVGAAELQGFDRVVLATGITPRPLAIPGADHPKVVSYADVLTRRTAVGGRVAIVGAGGIGFDVAEFLAHGADARPASADAPHARPTVEAFVREHGIDAQIAARGGLLPRAAAPAEASPTAAMGKQPAKWAAAEPTDAAAAAGAPAGAPADAPADAADAAGAAGGGGEGGEGGAAREIFLLQRKSGKHGAGLGRTTGWIHRASLKRFGVQMLGGVHYSHVDDAGLHIELRGKRGAPAEARLLAVDHVVVCAGQTPLRELEAPLREAGVPVFTIGGAHEAAELDAKRAIDQGSRLAAAIEEARPDKVGEYVAPLGFDGWLFQQVKDRMRA